MTIAENIRNLRERNGLTQERFGEIAGVSSMAVSQWENGRAVPRMGAVQRLSDYFGVTKGEIIDDSDIEMNFDARQSVIEYYYSQLDDNGKDTLVKIAKALSDGMGKE